MGSLIPLGPSRSSKLALFAFVLIIALLLQSQLALLEPVIGFLGELEHSGRRDCAKSDRLIRISL
jgi:hypothetical protein